MHLFILTILMMKKIIYQKLLFKKKEIMEHRSCYKNETHSFIHVIEAITKKINTKKQVYGKWVLLIKPIVWIYWFFFPERKQEERTKKIQNKVKYRNKKFFFYLVHNFLPWNQLYTLSKCISSAWIHTCVFCMDRFIFSNIFIKKNK